MNNEFNEHKKADRIKWIVVFTLIAVLLVGMIASFTLTLSDMDKDNKAKEQLFQGELVMEYGSTPYITLSEAVASSETPGTMSKYIFANVTPATASNKEVDWSVKWGDGSNETDVSEYITVTPSSDGSTEATVTCHKPFEGIILVICTTREGGYTAECSVEYVGMPTSLSISGSLMPVSDESLGSSYKLGVGTTYTFTISGENEFNQVGSNFNDYSVTVIGHGDLTMGELHHNNITLVDNWYDEYTSSVEELKDNLINVSLSGNDILVKTKKSIEGYYGSARSMDGGRNTYYYDKVKSVDSDAYFEIIVTERTTLVSVKIYLRFDDNVVTGVNLSGSLQF